MEAPYALSITRDRYTIPNWRMMIKSLFKINEELVPESTQLLVSVLAL